MNGPVEAVAGVEVRYLDEHDAAALVDRAARHYLSMSGEEFADAWSRGKFDGDADRPDVMAVAVLLPGAR